MDPDRVSFRVQGHVVPGIGVMPLSQPVKDPLRPLSEEERAVLEQIARSRSAPAEHVIRAKLLLAVACGMSHSAAARSVGRRSNDAVTHLVSRFNREGLAALGRI